MTENISVPSSAHKTEDDMVLLRIRLFKQGDNMALLKSRLFLLSGSICVIFVLITYNGFENIGSMFAYTNRDYFIPNRESCMHNKATSNFTWLKMSNLKYEQDSRVFTNPAKRLLLVAHYRGGSTFLGDMFGRNPVFFYWYEPLLSYYHRIIQEYMGEHMNIIADHYQITNNRTLRPLPDYMLWYRTLGLHRTLWCDVCVGGYNQHVQTNIRDRGLHEWEYPWDCRIAKNPYPEHCMAMFYEACSMAKMIVTKTIRYPLYALGNLLKDDPDLKVIYSIRDPRAIIHSRRLINTDYVPMEDWINMGISYCYKFKLDQVILRQLQDQYPGRLMYVRYEDLAAAPQYNADIMYDFVGHKMPIHVKKWIRTSTELTGEKEAAAVKEIYGTKRNSRKTLYQWREDSPREIIEGITTGCGDILGLLGYE